MWGAAAVRYYELMNRLRLARIMKALADPRRFEILERIATTGGEISCVDLRAKFPISRATMSHHVKELIGAGLIERRRKSRNIFLRMRGKTWDGYLQYLRRIGS
jgi:ArsR family transcriptional regulator